MREGIERRPETGGKLLVDDIHDYRYRTYLKNLELHVIKIWDIYNGCADCGNRIKVLKQDFRAPLKSSRITDRQRNSNRCSVCPVGIQCL